MSSADPYSRTWSLSEAALTQLKDLLQLVASELGANAAIAADQDFPPFVSSPEPTTGFTLLISPAFCALLRWWKASSAYQVALSFDWLAIAQFVQSLEPSNSKHETQKAEWLTMLAAGSANQPDWQSEFTLRLVSALSTSSSPPSEQSSRDLPDANASLQQQLEQERLINQVTVQIRQSLDLEVILQTAVEQSRHLLNVDRLVIYQLNLTTKPSNQSQGDVPEGTSRPQGVIIHEARRSDQISSVLDSGEDVCFNGLPSYHDKYLQGTVLSVEDIDLQYASNPCLLDFLRTAQIRAKLVVPILVQQELWGFIIAHDCERARVWQPYEERFLTHIAEHLAIAISQAQLYEQLQRQKQTLEHRVIERTQDLQDAMLAAQLANLAKGEFLAAVSHELRTPLTCIIGMSTTLQRWTDNILDERQKHFLQVIHDSGETLLELINNILDLSKLEAGKAVLNLGEFSLTLLAQQMLRAFHDRAVHNEIELILDIQLAPLHDRCTADQRRVQQILSNLLSNAIKFTNPGGKVTLRLVGDAATTIIQVIDTGIGIPAHKQSLLFQKFQQLDASYQREYSGLGVGLALTKHLVELHDGKIEVESTVGIGSIFTVYLPKTVANLNGRSPSQTSLPSLDKTFGRVALIETNEDTASIICDVLNAAAYQLIWMIEGSMALAQVEILQPQVVLIGHHLADSDGFDIIQSLRQNSATRHLKIIVILAKDDLESQQLCQRIGADDWITKPVVPEQVLVKVNALIAATNSQTSVPIASS